MANDLGVKDLKIAESTDCSGHVEPVVSSELKQLLYCVDCMATEYRDNNHGNAQQWIRHIEKAYGMYQELEDS